MATEYELTVGEHEVKWSKAGYQDLVATIDVTEDGVTCKSVEGGACYTAEPVTAPGVLITPTEPFTVKGYLAKADICSWIEDKGGWDKLTSYDITTLILAYLGIEDIGFSVTTSYITGAILYYLGNKAGGNALTGCSF